MLRRQGGTSNHLAGILVLAEGGSGNDWFHVERLCYEVDSLGGTVGDDDLLWGNIEAFGNHFLQRPCLGLWVVVEHTTAGCQIVKQFVVVGGWTDVRREVAVDVAIFVGVVAVAFNHNLGGFRKFFPYPHIS